MSRPNTGSTTDCGRRERHAGASHSSSVSHAPATAPATPSASSTATSGDDPGADRDDVGHVLRVEHERRRRPGPPGPAGPVRAGPPVGRAMRALRSAWRWASARRPATSRSRPGPLGIGGRHEPAGEPQVAAAATTSAIATAADEQPDLRPEPVQKTLSKPTRLVPDGVGPEVDARRASRMTSRTTTATTATRSRRAPQHRAARRAAARRRPGRRPAGRVPRRRRRAARAVAAGVRDRRAAGRAAVGRIGGGLVVRARSPSSSVVGRRRRRASRGRRRRPGRRRAVGVARLVVRPSRCAARGPRPWRAGARAPA